jgi:glycerophosphoryl diester phosphodiesterase
MVSPDCGVGYRTGMSILSRREGGAPPIVIAHRGASRRALENSLEAFSLSLADRADMIECDVRLSADGEPVVIHDARTGRTGRENLAVARCDAARLRTVRLNNGERVPFLASLRAIDGTGYLGELLLSSSLREECRAARSSRPAIPCGLVTGRPSASDIAFCLRHGLASIHPDARRLSVLRIRKVVEAGLPFVPYTVDDEGEFFRLVGSGASGVFSNRAEELRKAWRERFPGEG